MIVELVSVGTELLLGNIVNTNAAYLSEKCAALGLSVYYQVTVGDNNERLKQTVQTAYDRSDIVILTGGLGPTCDDITKKTVSQILDRDLYFDEGLKKEIYDYLKNGPYDYIAECNYLQAYVPEGAIILHNDNGTAPGLIIENGDKAIILLPGPPKEMQPMFEKQVMPYLRKKSGLVLTSKMIKIAGVGESQAADMLKDILDNQTNPTIAPYAKTAQVHFRITAAASSEEEGYKMIQPLEEELYRRFGDAIFTTKEEETIGDVLVQLLKEKNYKLATAESCTGGRIAEKIVTISGASSVFEQGYVTYSDEAKTKMLGVPSELIKTYGVVSAETALAMAKAAAQKADCEVAISSTGIAGPTGATKKYDVGTVFLGCVVNGKSFVKEYHFSGNRENVRENAAMRALDFVRRSILDEKVN